MKRGMALFLIFVAVSLAAIQDISANESHSLESGSGSGLSSAPEDYDINSITTMATSIVNSMDTVTLTTIEISNVRGLSSMPVSNDSNVISSSMVLNPSMIIITSDSGSIPTINIDTSRSAESYLTSLVTISSISSFPFTTSSGLTSVTMVQSPSLPSTTNILSLIQTSSLMISTMTLFPSMTSPTLSTTSLSMRASISSTDTLSSSNLETSSTIGFMQSMDLETAASMTPTANEPPLTPVVSNETLTSVTSMLTSILTAVTMTPATTPKTVTLASSDPTPLVTPSTSSVPTSTAMTTMSSYSMLPTTIVDSIASSLIARSRSTLASISTHTTSSTGVLFKSHTSRPPGFTTGITFWLIIGLAVICFILLLIIVSLLIFWICQRRHFSGEYDLTQAKLGKKNFLTYGRSYMESPLPTLSDDEEMNSGNRNSFQVRLKEKFSEVMESMNRNVTVLDNITTLGRVFETADTESMSSVEEKTEETTKL